MRRAIKKREGGSGSGAAQRRTGTDFMFQSAGDEARLHHGAGVMTGGVYEPVQQ